jgi:hypothetical protein
MKRKICILGNKVTLNFKPENLVNYGRMVTFTIGPYALVFKDQKSFTLTYMFITS